MLICFIDIALLVTGIAMAIVLLTNGSFPVGNKELRGPLGYVVAVLLMAPLPVTFLIGCGMGVNAVRQGKQDVDIEDSTAILIEVVPLVVCLFAAGITTAVGAKPKRRKKKRRRPENEDYDDYAGRSDDDYDRPRRRRRLDEEEEEEERRSGSYRRRLPGDDDVDDIPRRRRRDDDEDDEDRPRRRRREDDE